jgi:hypothetical protein
MSLDYCRRENHCRQPPSSTAVITPDHIIFATTLVIFERWKPCKNFGLVQYLSVGLDFAQIIRPLRRRRPWKWAGGGRGRCVDTSSETVRRPPCTCPHEQRRKTLRQMRQRTTVTETLGFSCLRECALHNDFKEAGVDREEVSWSIENY